MIKNSGIVRDTIFRFLLELSDFRYPAQVKSIKFRCLDLNICSSLIESAPTEEQQICLKPHLVSGGTDQSCTWLPCLISVCQAYAAETRPFLNDLEQKVQRAGLHLCSSGWEEKKQKLKNNPLFVWLMHKLSMKTRGPCILTPLGVDEILVPGRLNDLGEATPLSGKERWDEYLFPLFFQIHLISYLADSAMLVCEWSTLRDLRETSWVLLWPSFGWEVGSSTVRDFSFSMESSGIEWWRIEFLPFRRGSSRRTDQREEDLCPGHQAALNSHSKTLLCTLLWHLSVLPAAFASLCQAPIRG